VVCGDQSSGKSSVLQAIAGIPFPHSSDQCTRFPTEVILKRSAFEGIAVSIKSFSTGETNSFGKQNDLTSIGDLFDVIKKAGEKVELIGGFSRDILQIEISSPKNKPLILVDLPGLIHNGPDSDVVSEMVGEFMRNPRTIILAVVTAANDPDLQAVLSKAKQFDPKGRRTLGIITKPDKSEKGNKLENKFIRLAKNLDENFKFQLGWHVLMNGIASDGDKRIDLARRELEEKKFFESGSWSEIARAHCCIGPLRQRLSNLLLKHVKQELKGIRDDINVAIEKCKKERAEMGELHMDIASQREFLIGVGKKYNELCMQAVWGHYANAGFFGTGFSSNPEHVALFLRARIRNLNSAFASTFWKYGHLKEIEDSNLVPAAMANTDEPITHFADCRLRPDEVTRKYAIVEWVKPVANRVRGTELNDGRNPTLVKMLFCEQSQKWETLAYRHLDECSAACRKFLQLVLDAVVPPAQDEVRDSLHERVEKELEGRIDKAKQELESIIHDCRTRFPITDNYQYSDDVNAARAKRSGNGKIRATVTNVKRTLGSVAALCTSDMVIGITDLISTLDGIDDDLPDDPENMRCEASLDEMLAYYKVGLIPYSSGTSIDIESRPHADDL